VAATRVQSVSNQSLTTSIPVTSAQGWAAPTVGNLIVAWYSGDNTCTAPTGYTAGPSVVDANAVYFWWKIATAGDSAGVTFTQGGATPGTAGLIEYSGVLAPSPAEAQGGSATFNTTANAAATVGPLSQAGTGSNGDLFLALAGAHSWSTAPTSPAWTNSFTNFATVTQAGASSGNSEATFLADFQNTAAATPSTTCTWTNNALDRSGIVIAFALAAGGGTPTGGRLDSRATRRGTAAPYGLGRPPMAALRPMKGGPPADTGTTQDADASLDAVIDTTADAERIKVVDASLDASADTTTDATRDDVPADASLAGTQTSTATGARIVTADASLAATATSTATASRTVTGSASLAATETSTATVTHTANADASLAATQTSTATGARAVNANATATTTESSTATGARTVGADSSLAATDAFTATAARTATINAAATTTEASTATAARTTTANSTATATAATTATAVRTATGDASLTGGQASTAAAARAVTVDATLAAASSSTATTAKTVTVDATLSAVETSTASASGAQTSLTSDNFETYPVAAWPEGAIHGTWLTEWNGGGAVQIVDTGTSHALRLESAVTPDVNVWGDTASALVTSSQTHSGDLDFSVDVRTLVQLRALRSPPGTPNAWEVAWLGWNFKRLSPTTVRYYYIALKPGTAGVSGGFELGKVDQSVFGATGGQRFLWTDTSDVYPVGSTWRTVRVSQVGARIQVWVDGALKADFVDGPGSGGTPGWGTAGETVFTDGGIALYEEDARAEFDNLKVTQTATATFTATGGGTASATTQKRAAGSFQTVRNTTALAGPWVSATPPARPVGTVWLSGTPTQYGGLRATGTTTIVIAKTGSFTLSGGGSLTETGAKRARGAITASGGGSLTEAGAKRGQGAATLSGGGSLSFAAARSTKGSVSLSGGGATSATGLAGEHDAITLSGGGSLAATAAKRASSSTAIAGGGSPSETGIKAAATTITVSGGGSLTATARRRVTVTVAITGGGSLSMVGIKRGRSPPSLSGGGSLTETGARSVAGSATLSGGGSLSATGKRKAAAAIALSGGGSLSAAATRKATAATTLSGGGSLAATGRRSTASSVTVTGGGALSATTRALRGGHAQPEWRWRSHNRCYKAHRRILHRLRRWISC
jgi:hypothetical protein